MTSKKLQITARFSTGNYFGAEAIGISVILIIAIHGSHHYTMV